MQFFDPRLRFRDYLSLKIMFHLESCPDTNRKSAGLRWRGRSFYMEWASLRAGQQSKIIYRENESENAPHVIHAVYSHKKCQIRNRDLVLHFLQRKSALKPLNISSILAKHWKICVKSNNTLCGTSNVCLYFAPNPPKNYDTSA